MIARNNKQFSSLTSTMHVKISNDSSPVLSLWNSNKCIKRKNQATKQIRLKQQLQNLPCPSSFGSSSCKIPVPCLPICTCNKQATKGMRVLQLSHYQPKYPQDPMVHGKMILLLVLKKLNQKKFSAYPSALPHWPGRDEIQANNLPLPNCSSMWGSSVRHCWRFSSFLRTWLLFFASSVAPSPSCPPHQMNG